MPSVQAAGRALHYEWIGSDVPGKSVSPGKPVPPGKPVLVFLHEGLGSIRQWRDFPARVAEATGCRALLYDRYGYGQSETLAEPGRTVSFMHDEALKSLPALLSSLDIENPVLVGHSDGASIALIHAGAGNPVRGVVAMAPHVFIEEICITSIAAAKRSFETTDLPSRLGRYHRDVAKTFYGWADVWLDPRFKGWDIRQDFLPGIRCPVLAVQGRDDEYGTLAQLDEIERRVAGPCSLLKLERCGHSPFKDQPQAVLSAVGEFVQRLVETSK